MRATSEFIQNYWNPISHLFSVQNENDYDRAVELLNSLIDEIGTDEQHPLYEFLDTLGAVIHAYEDRHYLMTDSDGAEMLEFFMEEHGVTASDLPEIGSEKDISDIISGKKELTISHIRALAERFHVSPAVFI